jgi:hypothetical protein
MYCSQLVLKALLRSEETEWAPFWVIAWASASVREE